MRIIASRPHPVRRSYAAQVIMAAPGRKQSRYRTMQSVRAGRCYVHANRDVPAAVSRRRQIQLIPGGPLVANERVRLQSTRSDDYRPHIITQSTDHTATNYANQATLPMHTVSFWPPPPPCHYIAGPSPVARRVLGCLASAEMHLLRWDRIRLSQSSLRQASVACKRVVAMWVGAHCCHCHQPFIIAC